MNESARRSTTSRRPSMPTLRARGYDAFCADRLDGRRKHAAERRRPSSMRSAAAPGSSCAEGHGSPITVRASRSKMLTRARAHGVYDDLRNRLTSRRGSPAPSRSAPRRVAADVFTYVERARLRRRRDPASGRLVRILHQELPATVCAPAQRPIRALACVDRGARKCIVRHRRRRPRGDPDREGPSVGRATLPRRLARRQTRGGECKLRRARSHRQTAHSRD